MSIPTDWDEALVKAGFVDGRSGKGPSWSQLAKAIGVHVSTLTSMRDGTRVTDGEIVAKVAEALRLDVLIVSGWVGRARIVPGTVPAKRPRAHESAPTRSYRIRTGTPLAFYSTWVAYST